MGFVKSGITETGMKKHLKENADLYIKHGEKRLVYSGFLGKDEKGFFVRKGNNKYRASPGRTIRFHYPDGFPRYFPIKEKGTTPVEIGPESLKRNVGQEAMIPWDYETKGKLSIFEDKDKRICPIIIGEKKIYPIEDSIAILHGKSRLTSRLFREYRVNLD